MPSIEVKLLCAYGRARDAWDAHPSIAASNEVTRLATALAAISDDYQGFLDEADDIAAESEG